MRPRHRDQIVIAIDGALYILADRSTVPSGQGRRWSRYPINRTLAEDLRPRLLEAGAVSLPRWRRPGDRPVNEERYRGLYDRFVREVKHDRSV